ncbi:hypothetical protein [Flavivirga eckloniae]|uniref:Biopolymer transporter ExbD n=1 Tax=Flavivirga eckloniae TaxID=1803846 RepID=A0A2K9PR25_9FLAO|nr:hypothetical protein [Flavivirga eckloniae]AUP79489.1 hypothetical protein C1H87_12535 [Flavivirga eckloniae]
MKITTAIVFLLMSYSVYSQSSDKNHCSENLKITFLDKKDADWELKNHSIANKYLNIVIDDSRILYLNNDIKDESELFDAIQEIEKAVTYRFRVVIGIKNDVPFEVFTDLLCWLSKIRSDQIGDIEVYHFD